MTIEQIDLKIASIQAMQHEMLASTDIAVCYALEDLLNDFRMERAKTWEKLQPRRLLCSQDS